MAKASPIQTSFNSGEFSPTLEGRVDVAKYNTSCKDLTNFIPMIQGPARRRSGTVFVNEVKDSADRTWLVRFEFSADQAYILEFGDQYIRFYTNHGQLVTGTVTAWNSGTAYVEGSLASSGGVNYYCKVAHTNQTPPNATYWYPLTGDIYEIPSPYAAADLVDSLGQFTLRMVQSADVVYICHPDYQTRKLLRYSASRWVIDTLEPLEGPFEDIEIDNPVTVYSSGETGTVTLTASAATFASTDVGSLFFMEQKLVDIIKQWESGKSITAGERRRSDGKTYEALNSATTGVNKPTHSLGAEYDGDTGVQWAFRDAGYGYVKITGYTNATTVTAEVQSRLPSGCVGSGNATTRWAHGKWSATRGYPEHVAFFRERLVFTKGQDVEMSVVGDFENFARKNSSGEVVTDQAISIRISSDQVNDVQWLSPSKGLLLGTAGGEYVIKELTTNEAFGPANVTVVVQSPFGSRAVIPVQVGEAILFVQRSGRKLRELMYDFGSDSYKSIDTTVLSEHITLGGITDLVYQQEPHSIVWAVRTDGTLLGFTYNKEQDVLGWHKHEIGGDGIVECVEAIPCPDKDQDDLWMIVRRTIDGSTKRYIEYLGKDFGDETAIEDAFFVDCGLTYDGSPNDTISGLDHLEGETVAVLADGASHPNRVVTSGSITLAREASVVQVGYSCPATLTTQRINAGGADGTSQGKTKRITKVVIRFLRTLGARAGFSETELDEIQFRSGSDPMDTAPPVFTGDKLLEWNGGYDFDGYITIKQEQPLPMTVSAIMPQVVTQDR